MYTHARVNKRENIGKSGKKREIKIVDETRGRKMRERKYKRREDEHERNRRKRRKSGKSLIPKRDVPCKSAKVRDRPDSALASALANLTIGEGLVSLIGMKSLSLAIALVRSRFITLSASFSAQRTPPSWHVHPVLRGVREPIAEMKSNCAKWSSRPGVTVPRYRFPSFGKLNRSH